MNDSTKPRWVMSAVLTTALSAFGCGADADVAGDALPADDAVGLSSSPLTSAQLPTAVGVIPTD
jgi:hypothetical protein